MPDISDDDLEADAFELSLDEMLDRVSAATRAEWEACEATAPPRAIARYDTLRAASPDWRVVAPLNIEEAYVLVPVTSRLRDLDDLRGRRINVGAPGSARATSGEALYRRLFAQPLPASSLRSVSKDAALQALLAGDGLDALVFFDGQPSAWLESLPGETRRRLKVLSPQATSAAGRTALQSYLPATIAPTLANDRTPVETLGEVAFLVASPQATRPAQALHDLCERLPAGYNKRLSARRAKAVRAFLLGKGLDPQMVHAQGQGTANPVADNATADGRARNRRTEVTFEGVRAVATNTR